MAGADASFDATEFRTDIRAVMTMGLPEDLTQRPTFHFPYEETYTVADQTGEPYDWTVAPTAPAPGEEPRQPVQVPCTVEVRGGGSDVYTEVGVFNAAEAVITLLDVDYALVAGFNAVDLGGNRYEFSRELPPQGLFEVTVHQIVVVATDES